MPKLLTMPGHKRDLSLSEIQDVYAISLLNEAADTMTAITEAMINAPPRRQYPDGAL